MMSKEEWDGLDEVGRIREFIRCQKKHGVSDCELGGCPYYPCDYFKERTEYKRDLAEIRKDVLRER